MKHEIHKINSFKITAPFTLEIVFEDQCRKTIHFLPILSGEMYGPLRDQNLFSKVKLDSEVHTLVWPNGADFDPAILYNWEQCFEELSVRSKKWKMLED